MRAWREPARRRPGARPRARPRRRSRRPGIDLDPTAAGLPPPRRRRPRDATTSTRTSTPSPGEPPVIGIVGAGAVGTALGVALTRAGWPVQAVASRDPGRRERFRVARRGRPRRSPRPQALVDEVELIILAVPDDAIAPLAAGAPDVRRPGDGPHERRARRRRPGAGAWRPGTQIGAFHPLVAFADTERAVAALHGATIAIEGDDQLAALLAEMAEAIGARPVRLAPGSKAAYHAAAVLAAGGFVALLDAIAELGPRRRAGRGRRAGDLRAAHRGDAGQRPGPRHRARRSPARSPAATSGRSRRTSRRSRPTRPTSLALYRAAGGARGGPRRGAGHAGTGARRETCAPPLQGRTEPVP